MVSDIGPLGLPYEIWGLVVFAIVVAMYFIFRTNYEAIPVRALWIFKNGQAYSFKAKEDLQGIFLKIVNARGKEIETIKKRGIPLEVKEIDEKQAKAYIAKFATTDAEGKPTTEKRAYLNVAFSKMKHERVYAVLEGTGETIDIVELATQDAKKKAKGEPSSGNAVVLHEEQSAAKELFKAWAEALAGSLRALVLPLAAGGAIGMAATLVLLILTGHFH